MAALGGHTNWSQVLSVGLCTAMSSRKVIMCETAPLSLLLNTALGWSSQQSLVQLVAGSTPGSTSCLCTLRLHPQTARKHLASERATPLAPDVNGAMHSYQGTSLSEMPWTANCNQRVVCQVGSTVSRVSSSLPMSRWYMACCPGLPPEHSGPPPADAPPLLSPHCFMRQTSVC